MNVMMLCWTRYKAVNIISSTMQHLIQVDMEALKKLSGDDLSLLVFEFGATDTTDH